MSCPAFFVIAGPQCAGKSTAKNYLYARYMSQSAANLHPPRNLALLQEMRQLVMHERAIHSGIFIDAETEDEIIRRDLERLEIIRDSASDRVYLDETNIFTLAHARRHSVTIEQSLRRYRELLQSLNANVIFFSASPSLSWTRRKPRYEERVAGFPPEEAAAVLLLYREYLDFAHSGLLELRKQVDIPIWEIDASGPLEDTLRACARTFVDAAAKLNVRLVPRF
jgi:thymidylate kinase